MNWNDLGSSVTDAMRRPRSRKKIVASSPSGPSVSTATGVKLYNAASDWYFVVFRVSASLATTPEPRTAWFKWLAASVSGQVKSQTRQRPWAQGRTVRPSGRFPSSRHSEVGSSIAGIFADVRARLMRSLTALWRTWRPADFRQSRPFVPELSTRWPQMHVWGAQMAAPRRSETAIRSDVSSSLVPTDEHGTACKKSPE